MTMTACMTLPGTLATCGDCERPVDDDGRCIYCSTVLALGLRRPSPDRDLFPPTEDEVMTLIDMSSDARFHLNTARARIGRDPNNQIVVPDQTTSRIHAFITYEYGRFWIEDLGSLNGTKLNGSHILDREHLSRGDVVSVGDRDFLVQ